MQFNKAKDEYYHYSQNNLVQSFQFSILEIKKTLIIIFHFLLW